MICSELTAEIQLCWYSEVQQAPSRFSRSIQDCGAKGRCREGFDDPGIGPGTPGKERVSLAVEQQDDRNRLSEIADGSRYGHSTHGSHLEIDHGDIDQFLVGCDCRRGGIVVVDEFVGSDAQSSVNLAHNPGIIGNHQYT
jgi:hypothetical protein